MTEWGRRQNHSRKRTAKAWELRLQEQAQAQQQKYFSRRRRKRTAKAWELQLQEQRPVFVVLQMLPREQKTVEVWELQMREPSALDRGAAKLQRRAAFGARTARVKSMSCCDTNMTSKGNGAEEE